MPICSPRWCSRVPKSRLFQFSVCIWRGGFWGNLGWARSPGLDR
ncbi:hypothetical protein PgNI_10209 [Pyricularia grisea]|uniref:Uncharacterized protein n=1 Tax=Pyricularia grisea TaxID=148305 RepID=A0A6P8AXG5_PYRGI|nr:hypothetical protein PgNI_10209 [Pyricularia grisea]TLD07040.1 hypothetical protein PgNI_10209 [Pyricularia grisea]